MANQVAHTKIRSPWRLKWSQHGGLHQLSAGRIQSFLTAKHLISRRGKDENGSQTYKNENCTCKRNLSSLTRNKHQNEKTHAQGLQKSLFGSLICDVIVAVALALRKLPKVAKRTTRFAAVYSKVTRLNHKRSRRGGFRRSSYFLSPRNFIRFVPLVAWQPRDVFHSSKNHQVFLTV